MSESGSPKPRIVIYGAGQYGGYIIRFATNKGWPIAAVFNRPGPKVGMDIGRLAGLDHDLGIVVQDCDSADYSLLRRKADIGIVTVSNQLRDNLPAYERLMSAGLNVGCHGSESYHPFASDSEVATRINALAKEAGVTFTGGGIWDMSRIWSGLLLLGPCTEIESLHHSSITNIESQAPFKARLTRIGIGMTQQQFVTSEIIRSPMLLSYRTVAEQVLAAAGLEITASHAHIEPVVFDEPVFSQVMEAEIAPNLCVGSRFVSDIETRQGVSSHTRVELRLFKPGEVEHMAWSVDGMPHARVRIERDDSAHATAASLFNRIPDIIAAPPGIVTLSELGPLKHSAIG